MCIERKHTGDANKYYFKYEVAEQAWCRTQGTMEMDNRKGNTILLNRYCSKCMGQVEYLQLLLLVLKSLLRFEVFKVGY